MALRLLQPEEWDLLTPLFDKQNWHLPGPETSFVLVDQDEEGKVVFCQMVQCALLLGPLNIEPEYANKGVWKQVGEMIEAHLKQNVFFPEIITIVTDEKVGKMAEIMGMHKEPGTVYSKQFKKLTAVGD